MTQTLDRHQDLLQLESPCINKTMSLVNNIKDSIIQNVQRERERERERERGWMDGLADRLNTVAYNEFFKKRFKVNNRISMFNCAIRESVNHDNKWGGWKIGRPLFLVFFLGGGVWLASLLLVCPIFLFKHNYTISQTTATFGITPCLPGHKPFRHSTPVCCH